MEHQAFDLAMPERVTTSVVFASPHSGRAYPADLMSRTVLDRHAIRSSEDAFVDLLLRDVPLQGAPLLCALAPRAYVDLNRSSDELDPALVEGVRRSMPNPRISSGLGVIPRVVANGRAIYRGKLTLQEAEERLTRVWRPYHFALQSLLQAQHARFGEAILFDVHSMPHEAIEGVATRGRPAPDVVLGDRFGASASSAVMERVGEAFAGVGLRTARNTPFAGAFTTQFYGRPSRRQHAVQIEIDRSLYMNEETLELAEGFRDIQCLMAQVTQALSEVGRVSGALAAE